MDQIPVRVLNQDTAGVLERIENGESLEVTSRGKPVARIVPVTHNEIDELVQAGWVTPAIMRGPIPMPQGKVEGNAVSAALHAMREEERW
ncbi:MAG: type II toxin-antitoxin system prevent-host-death family antitoxin [Actinomycetota bacterium]|nr:type II toxin-antitoxin system prevent-host-death family antitoxin [Actinomycetota bacterium]